MTIYTKIQKNEFFKKITLLKGEDNKVKREEVELSNEELTILENHYNIIIANLKDYETLISFDVYNLNSLNGILNYRDKSGEHKQVRY
ncbi:MAG: hypothetical protein EBR82_14180 [Caulobacteraceae bacterium]|nr:hypothetical protein [Caulobacteraceae bacterium]